MQSTLIDQPLAAAFSAPARFGKALLIIVITAVAYHYSLGSLTRELGLQTPLAYLGLVPLIGLVLAWYRTSIEPERGNGGLPLDFVLGRVLGVGLLIAAVLLALLVPVSVRFWLARIDLLSLPLFVAGTVTIFYGVRRLWVLRFPIAFLFLAWPTAYTPVLADLTDGLIQLTLLAVRSLSVVLPLAQGAGNGDLFMIQHADGSFPVVIASACAGVNSLVGYMLVGTALGYVVKGEMRHRIAWIAAGVVLMWLLNLARIQLIFVVGALFGREAALDVLHPIAGLVVFNVGVLVMMSLTTRFRLYFERPAASAAQAAPFLRHPRLHLAFVGLTAGIALALAAVNAGYTRYEPLTNGLGSARLATFDVQRASDINWQSSFVASFSGGQQFFGDTSTWVRYQYVSTPAAELESGAPIYLDAISVDDPNALIAFGLEDCYRFHGYRVEAQHPVELAPGVNGEVISYHNPKQGADWSALWWEWPYEEGGRTRYQRLVLFISDGPRADYKGVIARSEPGDRFATTEAFLAALGRSLVAQQLASEVGA